MLNLKFFTDHMQMGEHALPYKRKEVQNPCNKSITTKTHKGRNPRRLRVHQAKGPKMNSENQRHLSLGWAKNVAGKTDVSAGWRGLSAQVAAPFCNNPLTKAEEKKPKIFQPSKVPDTEGWLDGRLFLNSCMGANLMVKP